MRPASSVEVEEAQSENVHLANADNTGNA